MKDHDNTHTGKRILFICLGNICRSPAAEGVMKAVIEARGYPTDWTIDSAGIGSWHVGDLPDHRMRRAARARGYELAHRCRQIRSTDFDDFDMIIGMDDQNISDIRSMARTPDDLKKIHAMREWLSPDCGYDHVPDPYYQGAEGFERVLDLLEDGCERLYHDITKKDNPHYDS